MHAKDVLLLLQLLGDLDWLLGPSNDVLLDLAMEFDSTDTCLVPTVGAWLELALAEALRINILNVTFESGLPRWLVDRLSAHASWQHQVLVIGYHHQY